MKEKDFVIDGTISLIDFLKENFPKSIGVKKSGFYEKEHRVVRKTFKNISFKGNLHNIEFRGVKFVDCEFEGIWGFYCVFQNCEFEKTNFRNCRFSHLEMDWNDVYFHNCSFRNIEIDEGCVFNLTFEKCYIINVSFEGLFPSENIRFYNSEIEMPRFDSLQYYEDGGVERDDEFIDLLFQDCAISSSSFFSTNFRNSRFIDTILYKTSFFDCELDNDCFIIQKKLKYVCYSSMDFQTILRSDELSEEILSVYFDVKNNSNLKKIISIMTSPRNFSTVFISYSFKDSAFAKRINEALIAKGVRTFMWEKDAPAGKPLEEIMSTGVTSHDKILFIASEFSIRSKACQYELTTARKKQEASWENVFFPITIDKYLFKVKKAQIRPIENANEYWENIEEIKRVNALDFSEFNTGNLDEGKFEEKFEKIVDGLKIDVA